ncbi:MAG TPA: clostripain-related cysteine peptidase [Petrotogaceae bacterium]|nr:clostripain-related cysteine peptidase [Petrotogaceae bacterium]
MRKKKFILISLIVVLVFMISGCVIFPSELSSVYLPKGNYDKALFFRTDVSNVEFNGLPLEKKEGYYVLAYEKAAGLDYGTVRYESSNGQMHTEKVFFRDTSFQMVIYSGGDNSLTSWTDHIWEDLSEICDAVANSSLNMTVNFIADYKSKPDRLWTVYKFEGSYACIERLIETYNSGEAEIDSGSCAVAESIILEVASENKNTDLFLDFWNHGSGWLDESYVKSMKSIVQDSTSGTFLKIGDVRRILSSLKQKRGRNTDIVGFDACSMSCLEVIYEVSELADYFVGSVFLEDVQGWHYEFLKEYRGDNEELLKALVSSYAKYYKGYKNISMSAVRLRGFKSFIKESLCSIKSRQELLPVYYLGSFEAVMTDVIQSIPQIKEFLVSGYVYTDKTENYSGIGFAYSIGSLIAKQDYKQLLFYKDNSSWIESVWGSLK